jgi:hypothetical protein
MAGTSGSGGSSASGGAGGARAGAGSGGTSGGAGSAGSGGGSDDCVCPSTVPLSGGACPNDCGGPVCAYEDCDGEGFVQAGCAGEWVIIQTACGNKPCGPEGAPEMNCAPGTACIQVVGGALGGYSCVPHDCGSGPIGCDCLEGCPGECTKTGGTTFTCNTCPSNLCP